MIKSAPEITLSRDKSGKGCRPLGGSKADAVSPSPRLTAKKSERDLWRPVRPQSRKNTLKGSTKTSLKLPEQILPHQGNQLQFPSLRLPITLSHPEPAQRTPVLETIEPPRAISWTQSAALKLAKLLLLLGLIAFGCLPYYLSSLEKNSEERIAANTAGIDRRIPLGAFAAETYQLDRKETEVTAFLREQLQSSIRLNKPERAQAVYEKSLALQNPRPRLQRAVASLLSEYFDHIEMADENRFELLKPLYAMLLDRAPTDPQALAAGADFLLRFGEGSKAITLLTLALDSDADNIDLKKQLARTQLAQGNKELALSLAREIAESHPSQIFAKKYALSFILELGLDQEALDACNGILAIDPTDVETQFKKSEILSRLQISVPIEPAPDHDLNPKGIAPVMPRGTESLDTAPFTEYTRTSAAASTATAH